MVCVDHGCSMVYVDHGCSMVCVDHGCSGPPAWSMLIMAVVAWSMLIMAVAWSVLIMAVVGTCMVYVDHGCSGPPAWSMLIMTTVPRSCTCTCRVQSRVRVTMFRLWLPSKWLTSASNTCRSMHPIRSPGQLQLASLALILVSVVIAQVIL